MKLSNINQKSIMLALTLLAFLLRAYRLDGQSYWIDEAWTLFYANLSLPDLLDNLRTIRAAPPLYHVLTIYWVQLLGDGEYALRFLSLVTSVMAVPLLYRLGQALGSARLGLIAALLLTVAPYQIWHAQDARNYSMLTTASIMSMWGFFNLWRFRSWPWWFVYVLGTEWAIMTHYHGLLIIGVQGLFFLVTWRQYGRYYLAWGGTLLVILAPAVAWLTIGSSLWRSQHWLPQVGLGDSYLRSAVAFSVGELTPRPQAIPLTLIFVILYGLGLIYATRRHWSVRSGGQLTTLLIAYTLAPHIAIWIYSRLNTSVYLERYLISIQAGYFLTIAAGILALLDLPAWLRVHTQSSGRETTSVSEATSGNQTPLPIFRKRSGAPNLPHLLSSLVLLLLIGISLWVLNHHYTDSVYAKPDWRGIVHTIENNSLPGDGIVLTGDGGEKLFDYYYRGELPVYDDFNTPSPPPDSARDLIESITRQHRRLWFTPYGVDIDATLETWLAENTYPAWHSWLGRKRLALYHTQGPLQRIEPLNVTFSSAQASGPTLLEVALPNESVAAGDLLPLALTWATETKLSANYQLSLRLSNDRGDIFSQNDWPPLGGQAPTSAWPPNQPVSDRRSLWLPVDIPPGHYILQLVVYDPDTGSSLGQPVLIRDIAVAPAALNPPPETLTLPNRRQDALGALTLVGYAAPEKISPGQEMWLWLYWRADEAIVPTMTLRLEVGHTPTASTMNVSLVEAAGPVEAWQPGQIRRTIFHLPTSPKLTGEIAALTIALLSPTGSVKTQIELPPIALEIRPRTFEAASPQFPAVALFGQPPKLRLVGYDLSAPTDTPGDELPVTLYWQAEAEMHTNYTVFLQLLNEAQQVVAQVDLQPQAGGAPTTTWLPGEFLTDPYRLTLPPDLPPGEYQLIAGLYDSASGERLAVSSDGDFIRLQGIIIK